MQKGVNHNESLIIQQNISYYDAIAPDYDLLLEKDQKNDVARKKMKEKFRKTVDQGIVLDFGGGTGKDLAWLAEGNYQVIFCEPSSRMREIAIRQFPEKSGGPGILFLDDPATDVSTWEVKLPFSKKTDAILCNFAVINCIPGLAILFKNLASAIRSGGHLLILSMNCSFKKRWRSNRLATLISLITGKYVKAKISYKDHRQTVYLYTLREIKRASAPYFDFCSRELLKENEFLLIHLARK